MKKLLNKRFILFIVFVLLTTYISNSMYVSADVTTVTESNNDTSSDKDTQSTDPTVTTGSAIEVGDSTETDSEETQSGENFEGDEETATGSAINFDLIANEINKRVVSYNDDITQYFQDLSDDESTGNNSELSFEKSSGKIKSLSLYSNSDNLVSTDNETYTEDIKTEEPLIKNLIADNLFNNGLLSAEDYYSDVLQEQLEDEIIEQQEENEESTLSTVFNIITSPFKTLKVSAEETAHNNGDVYVINIYSDGTKLGFPAQITLSESNYTFNFYFILCKDCGQVLYYTCLFEHESINDFYILNDFGSDGISTTSGYDIANPSNREDTIDKCFMGTHYSSGSTDNWNGYSLYIESTRSAIRSVAKITTYNVLYSTTLNTIIEKEQTTLSSVPAYTVFGVPIDYSACRYSISNTGKSNLLTGITAKNATQTIKYGETPNTTVTATFKNGSTQEVTALSNYTTPSVGGNSSVTKTVTLSYGGYTCTTSVTVTNYVNSISPSSTSTSVYYGTTPTMYVNVTYADGTVVNSQSCMMSGYTASPSLGTSASGSQTVTLTYTGGLTSGGSYPTTTTTITVKNYVKSIVANSSTQTVYYGVSIDSTATVTYATNSTQSVTCSNNYNASPSLGSGASGNQSVTLTYSGMSGNTGNYLSTTTTVTVKNYVKSIVANSSTQTIFYGGAADANAIITYATGATATVTCSVSGFSNTTVGVQTVTLTYSGMTTSSGGYLSCSVSVTVIAGLSSITPTYSTQTVYKGSSPILTAVAVYADGTSSKTVTPSNNFNSNTIGTQTVTLSYTEKGATKTTTCTVIVKPNVVGLVVTVSNARVAYGTTPTFTVNAKYEDSSVKTVSASQIVGYSPTTLGSQTVKYSYTENSVTVTGTVTVEVYDYPVSLEVTPQSYSIYQGQSLKVSTTVDMASGVNDKPVTATLLTDADTMTVGYKDFNYSYTYEGVTVTDTISILIMANLTSISTDKYSYTVYRGKSPSMIVTASYSYGDDKVLSYSDYNIKGFDNSLIGSATYLVSYTEGGITKTTEVSITVKPNVASVSIDCAEESTEGQLPSFELVVTYEDGTTSSFDSIVDGLSIIGYDSNSIGEQTIIFSYSEGGITLTKEIEVRVRAILKVALPLSLIVSVNPNTNSLVSTDAIIVNDSREPVKVELDKVVPNSDNYFSDVLPNFYSNWDDLGKVESKRVAFGFWYDDGEWVNKPMSSAAYFSNSIDKVIGEVDSLSEASLSVIGNYGTSFARNISFGYTVYWTVGLSD